MAEVSTEQVTQLLTTLLSLPTPALPALLSPTSPTHTVLLSLLHSSQQPKDIRSLLSILLTRLSLTPSTLSLPLLTAYAFSFGSQNATLVKRTIETALNDDENLLPELEMKGPFELVKGLELAREEGEDEAEQTELAIALSRTTPLLSSIYGQHPAVLPALSIHYNLLSDSTSVESLKTKLSVLETAYQLLFHAFILPMEDKHLSPSERESFSEELTEVLRPLIDDVMERKKGGKTPLVDRSLLEDLDYYFQFADRLRAVGEREFAREVEGICIDYEGDEDDEDDGLEILLKALDGSGGGKGKGKAVGGDNEQLSSFDTLSISATQILDLFPDLPIPFIRAALSHPLFASSVEKLTEALLEERPLPADLERLKNHIIVEEEEEKSEMEVIPKRRNIFENEKLDPKRLLVPGVNSPANLLNSPKLHLSDELKALIMARAEAPSSDDEDAYEEEDGDDEEKVVRVVAKRVEEESDSDNDEPEAVGSLPTAVPLWDGTGNPITPTIQRLLELTYIATSGTLFDTSSTTRRSPARKELRERTGLDDGILEGWRVNFERDPKKDNILQMHDAAYEANTNRDRAPLPPAKTSNRGGSGERGRGGRGGRARGSGRGDGGRRQRGADKKNKL